MVVFHNFLLSLYESKSQFHLSLYYLNLYLIEYFEDVYKRQVEVCGKKYLLTDFQERIWDCMDRDKLIGISAPTSAGKSFVILLKLVERLSMENLDIVYIVPTLSLVNQVTEDFNRELKTRCV